MSNLREENGNVSIQLNHDNLEKAKNLHSPILVIQDDYDEEELVELTIEQAKWLENRLNKLVNIIQPENENSLEKEKCKGKHYLNMKILFDNGIEKQYKIDTKCETKEDAQKYIECYKNEFEKVFLENKYATFDCITTTGEYVLIPVHKVSSVEFVIV